MRWLRLVLAFLLTSSAGFAGHQSKSVVFPPASSTRSFHGELVLVDFIHRTGAFRASPTSVLMLFSMPPYGSVHYLGADGDLRDVPLGTMFEFLLTQDAAGNPTRLATMRDDYSRAAAEGLTYRIDALRLGEGKILTSRHGITKAATDLDKHELRVNDATRVWKGDTRIGLGDLVVGDELLFNRVTGTVASPALCTDLWVGPDTHRRVTERQHKKHADFIKARGVPAWIERTKGNQLTVRLISDDRPHFEKTYLNDFAVGRDVHAAVANDELRTWNPTVDQERARVLDLQKSAPEGYGDIGVCLVIRANFMLEGFRKGHIVRLFGSGWPTRDQDFGESLMNPGFHRLTTDELMELTPKEYPRQFPFRTDYSNDHLPWYRLKPGVIPPRYSEHQECGELTGFDSAHNVAQFRLDGSGATVDIRLIPGGAVEFLNAQARLADLPVGQRYRLHLYQDAQGAFTLASLIRDEFSYLAFNKVTYRIEALKLDEGKIYVARQIPKVKNDQDDVIQPPDIGRAELLVNANTRIWKADGPIKLAQLAPGDTLLVNVTGEFPGHRSHCTDLWVGAATHKLVAERQAKKHGAPRR